MQHSQLSLSVLSDDDDDDRVSRLPLLLLL